MFRRYTATLLCFDAPDFFVDRKLGFISFGMSSEWFNFKFLGIIFLKCVISLVWLRNLHIVCLCATLIYTGKYLQARDRDDIMEDLNRAKSKPEGTRF